MLVGDDLLLQEPCLWDRSGHSWPEELCPQPGLGLSPTPAILPLPLPALHTPPEEPQSSSTSGNETLVLVTVSPGELQKPYLTVAHLEYHLVWTLSHNILTDKLRKLFTG